MRNIRTGRVIAVLMTLWTFAPGVRAETGSISGGVRPVETEVPRRFGDGRVFVIGSDAGIDVSHTSVAEADIDPWCACCSVLPSTTS